MTLAEAREQEKAIADLSGLAFEFEMLGRKALRASSGNGVLDGELRLIIALLDEPLSQAQLARRLAIDTGQINRTVDSLRKKELVGSRPSGTKPKDGYPLILTALGRKRGDSAKASRLSYIKDLLRNKSDPQIARLLAGARNAGKLSFLAHPGPYVRDAGLGDIGAMFRIVADAFSFQFGQTLSRVEEFVAETFLEHKTAGPNESSFLVAEYWGEVTGGIVTVPGATLNETFVAMLAVSPTYMGRGIGRALVDQASARASVIGRSSITGLVYPDEEGESLFRVLGWQFVRKESNERLGEPLIFERYSQSI